MLHCFNYLCKAKSTCIRYDKLPNLFLKDYVSSVVEEVRICKHYMESKRNNE